MLVSWFPDQVVKVQLLDEAGMYCTSLAHGFQSAVLGGPGPLLLMLFKLKRNVFTNILNGAADEHFSRDFYPHKP